MITVKMRTGTILVLAALVVSTAGAQPRRFVVAIVRLDGRLVPFAAWNGTEWERAWLGGYDGVAGTPAVDDVPSVWSRRGERVPRAWRVWPAAGGGPIPARVRSAEIVEAHCDGQIALKTDLPEPKRKDPEVIIEGRFGVAMHDSAIPVSAIVQLPRSHVLWRRAEQVVRAGFDARETAQAQAAHRQLPRRHPIPAVRLSKLYRQAGSSRSALYFEAERSYPTGPFFGDRTCPSRTIMTGWLGQAGAGALTLLDPRVFVTDCDLKEPRIGLPLAALRVANRSFWILQEHGYEDETYHVVEVGSSEVREAIKVDGGGC